jgi:hypothetical protein
MAAGAAAGAGWIASGDGSRRYLARKDHVVGRARNIGVTPGANDRSVTLMGHARYTVPCHEPGTTWVTSA